MAALNRVLIANRGEIAIRIARAAASLGIDAVGVYTPVDARSLHVHVVGEACELKGNDGAAAYLDGATLIYIALRTGCDAVHPGYGFLAESAAFAEQCAAAGLTFVGPPPDALRLLGDKTTARSLAQSAGVPVVPGSDGTLASVDEAGAVAAGLGYPVMLKASAGGGKAVSRHGSWREWAHANPGCPARPAGRGVSRRRQPGGVPGGGWRPGRGWRSTVRRQCHENGDVGGVAMRGGGLRGG